MGNVLHLLFGVPSFNRSAELADYSAATVDAAISIDIIVAAHTQKLLAGSVPMLSK
jgi:hypothetical protein